MNEKDKKPRTYGGDHGIKRLSESYRDPRDEQLRKEIGNFSEMSPEVVAQLLKNWLNSEEK